MTVFILAVCQAMSMSALALMMTATALAGKMLAADDSLATLPLAIQFIAAMLSAAPVAYCMRRFGRRAGFMIGAVVFVVSGLLSAMAIYFGSFTLFIVASIIFGFAQATSLHYRFAAAEAATPDFRPKAISLVLGGGVVAAVVGPNLANVGETLLAPYTFAGGYLFLSTFGIVIILVLSRWRLVMAPAEAVVQKQRPLREIVMQPGFIAALAAAMLGYGAMSFVMTATPLAMLSCGYSFGHSALVLQFHALGMYAPSFITGDIIKRVGERNVLLAGTGCYAATVMIGLAGVDIGHFWLSLILLGVGWNFLYVGGTSLLTRCYHPSERAKVQGFNDTMIFATVALCSFTAGTIEYFWGWNIVLLVSLVPMSMILFIVLRMGRQSTIQQSAAK